MRPNGKGGATIIQVLEEARREKTLSDPWGIPARQQQELGVFAQKRKESKLKDYYLLSGFSPLISPRWCSMFSTWPWKISSVTTGLHDLDIFLLNKMPWRTCLCCALCRVSTSGSILAQQRGISLWSLFSMSVFVWGGAGIAETTSANVPLLSRNDLPGHVTAGSHRDAG